jgi:hypothetical protein
MEASIRPPLTDSPWFWVLAFSLMAILALAAMSGKYGRRQAVLERQYQARERVAAGETGAAAVADAERRAYAKPGDMLIPLWPLAVLMAVVAGVSGMMLYRSRTRLGQLANKVPPS